MEIKMENISRLRQNPQTRKPEKAQTANGSGFGSTFITRNGFRVSLGNPRGFAGYPCGLLNSANIGRVVST